MTPGVMTVDGALAMISSSSAGFSSSKIVAGLLAVFVAVLVADFAACELFSSLIVGSC